MHQFKTPQRRSSIIRSLDYLIKRFVLRHSFLLARLDEFDLQFKVRTEDAIGRHIYKYHVHEPQLTALLSHRLTLTPGDVLIDVGANIGWYSILLDRLAPEAVSIYSFEPDPLNFELLCRNIKLNNASRVSAVQKALAAEEGIMTLYRHDNNNFGRHSLIQLQNGESVKVQTTTLDNFWEAHELGHRVPRFIKIDIEGYEFFALRGAERVLKRCPELLCEFSPEYMRTGGIDPAELVRLLTGHGFSPNLITSSGLEPVNPAKLLDSSRIIDVFWNKTNAG